MNTTQIFPLRNLGKPPFLT